MKEIKEKIIKATLMVLSEKKLEKTSINKVLKKLKMSSGNAYYYFKSKNEIYEEMLQYGFTEVRNKLEEVKKSENIQTYLFNLTKELIIFLEERGELLFLLLNIKGSSYLHNKVDSRKFLNIFEELLFKLEPKDCSKFRLQMFIGSVYEVLYMKKTANKNMTKEEINKLCEFFWGNILEKN